MKTVWPLVFALVLAFGWACNSPQEDQIAVPEMAALTCYFFFIPDCPASINNINKVGVLNDKYKGQVKFVGVLSEPEFDAGKLDSVMTLLDIDFPVVVDDSLIIAARHGATITPEFFLYAGNDELIYAGALDDYYFAAGRHKNTVSKTYLEDAIAASLRGKPVEKKRTKAFGCRIELTYFQSPPPRQPG